MKKVLGFLILFLLSFHLCAQSVQFKNVCALWEDNWLDVKVDADFAYLKYCNCDVRLKIATRLAGHITTLHTYVKPSYTHSSWSDIEFESEYTGDIIGPLWLTFEVWHGGSRICYTDKVVVYRTETKAVLALAVLQVMLNTHNK